MIYQHNNELRTTVLDDDTASVLLKNILIQMENEIFGKRKSERLVGGPKKLRELVENGAVRIKEDNGRMYYNASDVLLYCRCSRQKKERKPRRLKKQERKAVA